MIRLLTQFACIVGLLALLQHASLQAWRAYSEPPGAGQVASMAPPAATASVADGQALEFKGRDLAAYAETASRPLFFEGRRYPPIVKPAAAPEPVAALPPRPAPVLVSADGIKLLGIMIRGGAAEALIEVAAQPPVWVGVGQLVQAWTVKAIRQNSVRLGGNSDGRFATVSLYDGSKDD